MGLDSLFRFRNLEETLVIILDIGSASVGGALVLFNKTTAPFVVYTVRREIKFHQKIDFERFILSTKDTLDEVIGYLQKEGLFYLKLKGRSHLTPEAVHCIFGAPWYASQVRTLHVSREKPIRVNRDSLSEILTKEIHSFEDMESERYFREGIKRGEMELVEKETLWVKLNGYEVKKPYNRLAKELEVLLYLSVVPTEVVKIIHDRVTRAFHVETVVFHSSSLAFWSTIRDMWHNEEDYLVVDISGEITEISLVRGGKLIETASIPLGKNFFVRKIASRLKISLHEAFSLFNLYITEKGSEDAMRQVKEILTELKKEWLDRFQEALDALNEGLFLPTRMFLITDSFFTQWFLDIIKKADPSRGSLSTESFFITPVDDRAFEEAIHLGDALRKDPFLFMETVFVEKMFQLEE